MSLSVELETQNTESSSVWRASEGTESQHSKDESEMN